MGTIAPVPWVSAALMQEIREGIVGRILQQLILMKRPFTGLLYPGLMITPDGPSVLEFNARFGDTEAQSLMRLLKTSLLEILLACVNGTLAHCKIEWNPGFVACIVLASGGYPGHYEKGLPISGIEAAKAIPGVVVFHAGTSMADGTLRAIGGRVLNVTATGPTLKAALETAYRAANCIHFKGSILRHDIGQRSLQMMALAR
jgi:phosphoribosylamine--glycine ligase